MEYEERFCSGCGTPLEVREVEGRERPVCPRCGRVVYHNPKLVAVAVIARDGKVLLVRRATEPGQGLWSIPGGYVDRGEVVEEAAAREAQEETGLEVRIERLLGLYSRPGHPIVVAAYTARVVSGTPRPGPEVLEVGFFPPDGLPPVAFPNELRILEEWRRTTGQA
jgi:ADP-ribose pyrophosphatase YjhB (NUDIX family)